MGLRRLALYLFMLVILFGVAGYAYLAQQRDRQRRDRRRRRDHHHDHHESEKIDLFGGMAETKADTPAAREHGEDQAGVASGSQPPPSAL